MISENRIQEIVNKHIAALTEGAARRKYFLIPKSAEIIASTNIGESHGYFGGKKIVEKGNAYPHYWLGGRTVFFPEPQLIGKEKFYIELKGYGFNGQYLYPDHHSEGDLHYGMYLKTAQREYQCLAVSMSFQNIRSQNALALLKFSRDEFVRHSIRGIAHIICQGSEIILEKSQITKNIFKRHGRTEGKLSSSLYKMYEREGIEKVESLLSSSLKEQVIPLRARYGDIKEPAGYLIRAARAPFRLLCGASKGVSREDLNEAAYEGGRLYTCLLERDIIHHVPSAGNITIAGELMDFEDTSSVKELKEIRNSWSFMAKQFTPKGDNVGTLEEYLALTLGKRFLEEFVSQFLEGTGLGDTPQKAARRVIEMHRESFGRLVDKNYTSKFRKV